jgi:hypothetical protein
MKEYEVPPTCMVYKNYRDARHWRKTRKEQAYERRKIHQKPVKLEFSSNGFFATFLIHLFSHPYLTNFFLLCRTWCFNSSLLYFPIYYFLSYKESIHPFLSTFLCFFSFLFYFYSLFINTAGLFCGLQKAHQTLDSREHRRHANSPRLLYSCFQQSEILSQNNRTTTISACSSLL